MRSFTLLKVVPFNDCPVLTELSIPISVRGKSWWPAISRSTLARVCPCLTMYKCMLCAQCTLNISKIITMADFGGRQSKPAVNCRVCSNPGFWFLESEIGQKWVDEASNLKIWYFYSRTNILKNLTVFILVLACCCLSIISFIILEDVISHDLKIVSDIYSDHIYSDHIYIQITYIHKNFVYIFDCCKFEIMGNNGPFPLLIYCALPIASLDLIKCIYCLNDLFP